MVLCSHCFCLPCWQIWLNRVETYNFHIHSLWVSHFFYFNAHALCLFDDDDTTQSLDAKQNKKSENERSQCRIIPWMNQIGIFRVIHFIVARVGVWYCIVWQSGKHLGNRKKIRLMSNRNNRYNKHCVDAWQLLFTKIKAKRKISLKTPKPKIWLVG